MKKSISRNVYAVLLFSVIIALATGCDKPNVAGTSGTDSSKTGSAGDVTTKPGNLSGRISIDGSSTVEPISNRAKEKFNCEFPRVNISVSGQGTGNGFKALAAKECDLSDASRPIKQKELEICQQSGVSFYEIPVAYDGLTIVINKENDFVKQLTIEQLTQIFREDTAAKTWKNVNEAWPDNKISIYAPGIASGTHDYFVEVIGNKDNKGIRADDQTMLSEDDKALVTGVKGDKFAIGFFGFSYYEANQDELQAVPIVNPANESAITPSLATIESGEYAPFSRPLFIYVNVESCQRAEVREFVDFYLNNVVEIVKDASYVPLPKKIYESAKNHILKDLPGSHYLEPNGDKREGSLTEVYIEDNLSQ